MSEELCQIEPPQDPRELLEHLATCPKRHAWLVLGAVLPSMYVRASKPRGRVAAPI